MYFLNRVSSIANAHPFYLFLLLLIIFNNTCLAHKSITLKGTTIINTPTTFSHVTLNLNEGAFLITNNASLDIENCTINVTMSPTNPFFISLLTGSLTLKNNIVRIRSKNLPLTPLDQSLYYAIQIQQGTNVNIIHNIFSVDKFCTVGWLLTNQQFCATNLNVSDNRVENFHGGVYLTNSENVLISHNTFFHVSFGNIYIIGYNSIIKGNTIISSGNNNVGDGIDIIDSDGITVSDNFIGISSCYSILILRSKNILVDKNNIVGGITYGIFIAPNLGLDANHQLLAKIPVNHKSKEALNQNITVTNNYLGQNRFGLGAINVDTLSVHNNTFVQKFTNAASRLFWTDNANLLIDVTNLTWINNYYKEAYTQINAANTTTSQIFLPFPVTGGVVIPD